MLFGIICILFATVSLTQCQSWVYPRGQFTGYADACNGGETLGAVFKRVQWDRPSSKDYKIEGRCEPILKPSCVTRCKWAYTCRNSGFRSNITYTAGVGTYYRKLDTGFRAYPRWMQLFCCESTAIKMNQCVWTQQDTDKDWYISRANLATTGGLQNAANSVIRDMRYVYYNNFWVFQTEVCSFDMVDDKCQPDDTNAGGAENNPTGAADEHATGASHGQEGQESSSDQSGPPAQLQTKLQGSSGGEMTRFFNTGV